METTSTKTAKAARIHRSRDLRQVGTAASPLELGPPPLLLEPPFAGGSSRLGRAATATRSKRFVHPLPEACHRELAIACLTATVLGNRGHTWAEPRSQCVLLLVAQRLRGVDLEDRLDP
jgi:hypothetical protein